jgi:hypothetical protein
MRPAHAIGLLVSAVLLSLVGFGQTKNPPPAINLNSPIVQESSLVIRECKEGDWGLLDTAEAKDLLSDYDFEPFIPGRCSAVSATVDDFRENTLLRASSDSRLWLIPIEKGMVGYSGTPSNPYHLAAFNDLLRFAQMRITDQSLFEVSDLYQFLVGMSVKSDSHQKSFKETMSDNDIAGSIEHGEGFTDFTHREPNGDSWSSGYMVWEFRYVTTGKYSRL